MADLFSRLAERALGVAAVARPAIQSVFAPAPIVATQAFAPAPRSSVRSEKVERPDLVSEPGRVTALRAGHPPASADLPRETRLSRAAGETAVPTPAPFIPVEPVSHPAMRAEPEVQAVAADHAEAGLVKTQPIEPPQPPQPSDNRAAPPEIWHSNSSLPRRDLSRPSAAGEQSVPPQLPVTNPLGAQASMPAKQERAPVRNHDRFPAYTQPGSTVEVNIGRIEVRAVFPEQQSAAPVRRASDSALSLADYLKERDRGTR